MGTNINENWEATQEIRIRIAKAKAAFNKSNEHSKIIIPSD